MMSRNTVVRNDRNSRLRANHPLAIAAFNDLSPEEQENADRDLYGVEKPIVDESPEFVEQKLEGLSEELKGISEEKKKYYMLAVNQEKELLRNVQEGCCSYVTSRSFKIMFLRAELYDTKKAAKRLIRHFKDKHDLFGEKKLSCKIRQEDLGDDGKKVLYSGLLSHTGATDVFGRPIVVFRRTELATQLLQTKDTNGIGKVFFYLFQNIMDGNDIAQKKGIVSIGYILNAAKLPPSRIRAAFPLFRMGMYGSPFRVAGYHVCYNDVRATIIINLVLAVRTRSFRARFRGHAVKTHKECVLRLSSYGISTDSLPFTDDVNFLSEMVKNYLDSQYQLEKDNNRASTTTAVLGASSPAGRNNASDGENNNSDDFESSSDEGDVRAGQGSVQNYINDFCTRKVDREGFAR